MKMQQGAIRAPRSLYHTLRGSPIISSEFLDLGKDEKGRIPCLYHTLSCSLIFSSGFLDLEKDEKGRIPSLIDY
jgi:hypothetical protein